MRALALVLLTTLAVPSLALAQATLSVLSVDVDRPTLITLGVQVLIAGDDDYDARIDVRYRAVGEASFHDGMTLYRVHPEVSDMAVPEQFAGSIFELMPATTYEIELHAVDPDGLDELHTAMATTRAIPSDPATPHVVMVSDAAGLQTALDAASAGDVITLAAGTYHGTFSSHASGTASDPIVVRGVDRDSVVLDGDACDCNVIEIYGSYVHLESLTLQNATRALRFQGSGAIGNVVRRVHVQDVVLGIGSRDGQQDYFCDNELEGRLSWPAIYRDDGGAHANDDGIHLEGTGHVVCHNRIQGFGDAMKIETALTRAIDIYGNDVLSAYDNGIELDTMSGNGRVFRNRFTNTYATLSVQPIYGGPAYLMRNVLLNVADEQIKWHGLGTGEGPSGVIVLHNTFVSAGHGLQTSTSATSHYFVVMNNLWIGTASDGRLVEWDAPIDHGTLDYDGFSPDGEMHFRTALFPSFAAMQSDGTYEPHGVLLTGTIFESLTAPSDYHPMLAAPDATLASGSPAIDRGLAIAGIDYTGAAPDLGALERGCAIPIYGVRPAGTDETNEPRGCGSAIVPMSDAGMIDAGPGVDAAGLDSGLTLRDGGSRIDGGTAPASSGCGCRVAHARGSISAWMLLAALGVVGSRRARACVRRAR